MDNDVDSTELKQLADALLRVSREARRFARPLEDLWQAIFRVNNTGIKLLLTMLPTRSDRRANGVSPR